MKKEIEIMEGFKMATVQEIINRHGGIEALKEHYIRIENEPYMRLVIEWIGDGPHDTNFISVAHYYTQNGDPMRDPEIVFAITLSGCWLPTTFQQDGLGIYQEAVTILDGSFLINDHAVRDLQDFATTWDHNIAAQGFLAPD